jgi:hypothetical protein
MRKLTALLIALLLILNSSHAQILHKFLPPSAFEEALTKVIENYQNNYRNIQGELLPSDDDRDIFQSAILLPGATQNVIFRFHSKEDTSASWQAILYNGEDFKEASKVYKNSFKHLKQTQFKVGMSSISLEGVMENPTNEIAFTSSILRPSLPTEIYKNFIAEVEILTTLDGWTVQLNLHSRKEDTERYQ